MITPSARPTLRRLAALGTAFGALILSAGWIDTSHPGDPGLPAGRWQVGVARSIAVQDGRARFRVPAPGPTSQTLVIVSTLARESGPFPVRLTARFARTTVNPEPVDDGPRRSPRPADPIPTRKQVRAPSPPSFDRLPPRERTFHMMARDGDPADPGNYVEVGGVLRALGQEVQVYVDTEDVDRVDHPTLAEIVSTFDDRVLPMARSIGPKALDVDGDGRFTVFLSSRLEHLGGGRLAVDGFVRIADLDRGVPAPFGNRCDMMCLNAAMPPGGHLRSVLTHEYMHAVVYTARALHHPDGPVPGPAEEGWLDEAIAHLIEDSAGFSASNIDYRVSAFLSAPERYRLVVDDYYAARLFRSHGNRGSTYLFLRWCVDRYGPGLLPALVRTPLRGVANVEAATGASFAELFRRWTLAMFLSGLGSSETSPASGAHGDGYRSTNLRAPWNGWELAGPRYRRIRPGDPPDQWEAESTSTHYALVDGGAGAVEIEVEGSPDANLQVTAMPMGEDRARLSLAIEPTPGPDGQPMVIARVSEQNGVPVRLSSLSWEPVSPGPNPRADGRHSGSLDMLGIASTFGTSALLPGGSLKSRPILIVGASPEVGPIVLKLIGTDPYGRRVTAWADLNPARPYPAHPLPGSQNRLTPP